MKMIRFAMLCCITLRCYGMEQTQNPVIQQQTAIINVSQLPQEIWGHVSTFLTDNSTVEDAIQVRRNLSYVCKDIRAVLQDQGVLHTFIKRMHKHSGRYKAVIAYALKTAGGNQWLDVFVQKTKRRLCYALENLERVSLQFYCTENKPVGASPRIMTLQDFWKIAKMQMQCESYNGPCNKQFFAHLPPRCITAVDYLKNNTKQVLVPILRKLSQDEVKLSPSAQAAPSFLICIERIFEAELLHLKFQTCKGACDTVADICKLRQSEKNAHKILGLGEPVRRIPTHLRIGM